MEDHSNLSFKTKGAELSEYLKIQDLSLMLFTSF